MRKHLLLALSLLGLFDALYLLWVYTSPSRPIVCLGGGCDAVRASSYAHLFGVPLPAFGVANYLVLALLILAADLVSAPLARSIRAVLAAISGGGFLYSIYLTSLEKWVIHAWCTWCVISAITVTCIFLLSLAELRRPPAPAEPPAALANVRRNYVLCVVALLVGVPAFLVLSRHGDMLLAKQVSSKALAEHLVRPDNHMAGNLNAPLTVVDSETSSAPAAPFRNRRRNRCGRSTETAFASYFASSRCARCIPKPRRRRKPPNALRTRASFGKRWRNSTTDKRT